MDLRRKRKRTRCKLCEKKKPILSRRGYCVECSKKLNQFAVAQLRVKKGEVYDKWKRNLLRHFEE